MKRCIMTIIVLLCSFISVNLVSAATFTQADLTGTWHINVLRTGPEWMRARITVSSSGVATCMSMSDSTGGTTCPGTFNLTLTMNPSTGVITQTGADAPNVGTDHMTMASSKKFATGTATNASSYQLEIMQKEVTGTSYGAADLQNKSIVYHQLEVGTANGWRYGAGTLDETGAMTITSETSAPVTAGLPDTGSTVSVDSNGIVTSGAGMGTFQGFLSDDKKTVVGTFTEGGSIYKLMILQITGQTYAAGTLPAITLSTHVLGCGAETFWVHYTNTVNSSGVMTLTDWTTSDPLITNPTTLTGNIDASGAVTINENATFHGQLSHDRTFTVSTQTDGTSPNFLYNLSVSTKVTTTLYADLAPYGLFTYDGATWTQINVTSPASMAASGSVLYADLAPYGLFTYDGATWTQINVTSPASMAASGSVLYADLAPYGLFTYDGATWTQINVTSPASMAASGSVLYADLAPYGLFKYETGTWTQINVTSPASMAALGSVLYADLAPYGLFKYETGTWTQINVTSPASMAASGSVLYADLAPYGLFTYDGATWTQINVTSPASMAASGSVLYADLAPYGLFTYDGATWTQINVTSPASMATGF